MPKYMDESNAGGVAAKYGFYFQDVVATLYATQMLLDKQIIGVRCEVKDDIDILYKDRIEYVQVKTTDVGGKWTLKDLTSKKKSSSTKKHIPKSSILHKSMECDDDANLPSSFRLVTEQPVNNSLQYLTIPKANRNEKSGFEKLAKSINSGLGKNYLSPLGNNGNYWVENTYWEVLFSPEHIFEKAERNILQAANALLGHSIKLKDATDIAALITNNLLKKSQLSRVIHTADDKTYKRNDLLNFFNDEVKSKLQVSFPYKNIPNNVLLEFHKISILKNNGLGFHQPYELGKYRTEYIATQLTKWIEELLFKPEELSNASNQSTFSKYHKLKELVASQCVDINSFIARLIMHSIIRSMTASLPIPAILYIKQQTGYKKVDCAHIVTYTDKPDELWLGISKLLDNTDNITQQINNTADDLSQILMHSLDENRKIIFETKDDNYLLSHDIDDLLDTSKPISSNIDRFKFIIFLGYKSDHLKLNELNDYQEKLQFEIELKFKEIIQALSQKNKYFKNIHFNIYLYPSPCIDDIKAHFNKKVNDL